MTALDRCRLVRCQLNQSLIGLISLSLFLLLSTASASVLKFSESEKQQILSHGPWPVAVGPDPSNRVESRPEAISLGQKLFFEKRLSEKKSVSCASCHDAKRGFQDGRKFSRHGRNTQSLLNLNSQRWFGWDGATDSLWAASLAPLIAKEEVSATAKTVAALFKKEPKLEKAYVQLFGPWEANDLLLVNVSKVLAAYQATFVSPRSQFDAFRDALARDDFEAMSAYPPSAQRGLKIFVGSGRCFFCHTGPTFTNGEFADIGRPFFTKAGADPGRWGGLQQFLRSRFTRVGPFSDAAEFDDRSVSSKHVNPEPKNFGEFKVPGLRDLLKTAPYFHDGSAQKLTDVIRHYSEVDERRLHADGARILEAGRFTPLQKADLLVFLRSLSEPEAKAESGRK